MNRKASALNYHSILHVEDNDDDFFFVQVAAKTVGLNHNIQRAHDGQEAIDYLSGTGKFSNREEFPFPALVLLDMKMPRVEGMEVLRWIRSDSRLRSVIVIVLSSSPVTDDVDTAYNLGANSFLVKPSGIQEFEHIVRLINDYWLDINEVPSVSQNPHGMVRQVKTRRFPNLER